MVVRIVVLDSIKTKTVIVVVKIAQEDSIRIKTVKRVAKVVVQEFILLVALHRVRIAQLDNTRIKTAKVVAKLAMEANGTGTTRQERLLLAGDVENVKEQIRIALGKEQVVATWRGMVVIEIITSSYTYQILMPTVEKAVWPWQVTRGIIIFFVSGIVGIRILLIFANFKLLVTHAIVMVVLVGQVEQDGLCLALKMQVTAILLILVQLRPMAKPQELGCRLQLTIKYYALDINCYILSYIRLLSAYTK